MSNVILLNSTDRKVEKELTASFYDSDYEIISYRDGANALAINLLEYLGEIKDDEEAAEILYSDKWEETIEIDNGAKVSPQGIAEHLLVGDLSAYGFKGLNIWMVDLLKKLDKSLISFSSDIIVTGVIGKENMSIIRGIYDPFCIMVGVEGFHKMTQFSDSELKSRYDKLMIVEENAGGTVNIEQLKKEVINLIEENRNEQFKEKYSL
jgi:hypothetical protein